MRKRKTLEEKIRDGLDRKKINNSLQLHRYFPIRYIDDSIETGIGPDLVGKHVAVCAYLRDYVKKDYIGKRGFYLVCHMIDRVSNLKFNLTIFAGYAYWDLIMRNQQKYMFCSGILGYDFHYGYSLKCDMYAGKYLVTDNFNLFYKRINPVFSSIKDVDADEIINMIGNNLVNAPEEDTLPTEIRDKYQLMDINEALFNMNFSDSWDKIYSARKRLLFDDLFYTAASFTLSSRRISKKGIKITSTTFTDSIISGLPFKLTEDQEKTYNEIKKKMLAGEKITALIQGDVSCGKTIIAVLIAFLAIENGYQAIIMAPTKILANQHFEQISNLLAGSDYKPLLLADLILRQTVIDKIKSGEVNIIVGTSMVLSDKIEYNNMGIVIVDEEHKFGVQQREEIIAKSRSVNYIAMSATPIPRTLARSLYNDSTDIYEIHSMPNGRKPVKTYWADERLIKNGLEYILDKRQQAYVVCPAIETDEDSDVMKDVLSTSEAVKKYQALFPEKKVEELNGKMCKKDSDDVINRFKSGVTDILVSTTIIEVGVNVPNATMIIIENAERFGLSQMHQLRGRVGRGTEQSFCALVTKDVENERVKALCSTNDGFEIAMIDLTQLRKSGNLFGDEQSGFNRYVEEIWTNEDYYRDVMAMTKAIPDEVLKKHINKMIMADWPKIKPFIIPREAVNRHWKEM